MRSLPSSAFEPSCWQLCLRLWRSALMANTGRMHWWHQPCRLPIIQQCGVKYICAPHALARWEDRMLKAWKSKPLLVSIRFLLKRTQRHPARDIWCTHTGMSSCRARSSVPTEPDRSHSTSRTRYLRYLSAVRSKHPARKPKSPAASVITCHNS